MSDTEPTLTVIDGTARIAGQLPGYEHPTRPPAEFSYFWKFVHNAIIHPLLAFPWRGPRWLERAHDWTADRCRGAG